MDSMAYESYPTLKKHTVRAAKEWAKDTTAMKQ